MANPVRLHGGPRDGEEIDISNVSARVVFPGSVEERRAMKDEDGDLIWSWATHTYDRSGRYLGAEGGIYTNDAQ